MVARKAREKRRVLNIASQNSLGGGIGTVINYLNEGVNNSEEFTADNLFTSWDYERSRAGTARFISSNGETEKKYNAGKLEELIGNYDVVHVHGIPHADVLETLQHLRKNGKHVPAIVNTAHSSVKKEFIAQYEHAQQQAEINPRMRHDYQDLKYFYEHDILNNPGKFGETYWGSAIHRQEQIMTLSDTVQHMNEVYKNSIIDEFSAHENAHKHIVVPNGVKKIERVTERPKKKRILFVGRFSKEKGIDEFVESIPYILEEHPDAEIRFVGGDPENKILPSYQEKLDKRLREHFTGANEDEIRKYRERIHFAGWVSNKEKLDEHYRWTDYVIIPSKAESFSLAATEALMHKRIPIITKTKAMDDLYISKNLAFGIEEEQRHPKGIAETVNKILYKDSTGESDAMIENAHQYAKEHYSYETMIGNQLGVYRNLIKKDEEKKYESSSQYKRKNKS